MFQNQSTTDEDAKAESGSEWLKVTKLLSGIAKIHRQVLWDPNSTSVCFDDSTWGMEWSTAQTVSESLAQNSGEEAGAALGH